VRKKAGILLEKATQRLKGLAWAWLAFVASQTHGHVIPVHAWAKREVKDEDQRDLEVMGKQKRNI
jgi:hypothetical protein